VHQGLNLLPADPLVAYAGDGFQQPSIEKPVDCRLRNPKGGGSFGDGVGEGFGGIRTTRRQIWIHGRSITPVRGRAASERT
jgi:hypothetical protein